jgi:hypothetical protein
MHARHQRQDGKGLVGCLVLQIAGVACSSMDSTCTGGGAWCHSQRTCLALQALQLEVAASLVYCTVYVAAVHVQVHLGALSCVCSAHVCFCMPTDPGIAVEVT